MSATKAARYGRVPTSQRARYSSGGVDDPSIWDTDNVEADVEVDDEAQDLMFNVRERSNTIGDCCSLFWWFVLCLTCQFLALTLNSTLVFSTYDEIYDATYMSSTPVEIYGPVMLMVTFTTAVAVWLVWMEGGCIKQRVNIYSFLLHLVFVALLPDLFFASTYTFTSTSWTATTSQLRTVALFLAALQWILDFALMVSFWRVNLFAGMLFLPQVGWMCYVVGFIAVAIPDVNVEWWIHALLAATSAVVLLVLCSVCCTMICTKALRKTPTHD